MATKPTITGGMNKNWLREIGRSEEVSNIVGSAAEEAAEIANGMFDTYGTSKHGHTRITTKGPGIWNKTFIVMPRSAVAHEHAKTVLVQAAERAGARKKASK